MYSRRPDAPASTARWLRDPTILLTKLDAPSLPAPVVPRSRLLARLAARPGRRLTLVSAPAGSGKTTTTRLWLDAQDRPWAWLSLDERDNDLVRFFGYLLAAIQRVHPHLATGLHGGLSDAQHVDTEAFLTVLINEIAAHDTAFILVLDDYHLITAPAVHEALTFLLEHAPAQLHLALCSRANPPLPLARWVARGQAVALDLYDLRFEAAEAAALWDTIGLTLPDQDAAALVARTEGWATGLYLVGLALQRGSVAARAFADNGGAWGAVADYLVREVLDAQPDATRAVLLRCAILDRLTAPLCSAVAGVDEATARMVLADANLFIVPLDEQRRWYRYHHLFAAVLAARLEQETTTAAVAALHRRAGQWYEQEGLIDEAMRHLIAAGDDERMATTIERHGAAILWGRGEMRRLLAWLEALPESIIASRPRLCLTQAWLLFELYLDRWPLLEARVAQARARLQGAPARLAAVGPDGARQDEQAAMRTDSAWVGMRAEVDILSAVLAARCDDLTLASELCRRALALVPRDDHLLRGLATIFIAAFHLPDGDSPATNARMAEGMALSRAAGNTYAALIAAANLIAGLVVQGRPRRAETVYHTLRDALEAHPGPAAGMVHISAGGALYERGDLEGAEDALRTGLTLCRPFPAWTAVVQAGSITLARVLQARGDTEGAWATLARSPTTDMASHIPYLPVRPEAAEALLWLLQGNLSAAVHWAAEQGRTADDPLDDGVEEDYLVLACVFVERAQLAAARRLLGRLEAHARAGGRAGRLVEIWLLQASCAAAVGDTRTALDALRRALGLAEPEGSVRSFAENGATVATLLWAVSNGLTPAYRARLSAALPLATGADAAAPPPGLAQTLPEPLTTQERKTLALLAAGKSVPAIATDLVVEVSTVRTHVKRLYGKLGAHSRAEALALARQIGLL